MGRDESETLECLTKECLEPALKWSAQAESVSRRVRCPGDHAFQVNRASTSYLVVLFCGLVP